MLVVEFGAKNLELLCIVFILLFPFVFHYVNAIFDNNSTEWREKKWKKPGIVIVLYGFFIIDGGGNGSDDLGSTAEYEITSSSPHTPIIVFLTVERAYYTAVKMDGLTNHYQAVCVVRESYNFNVVKQMSHGGRPVPVGFLEF